MLEVVHPLLTSLFCGLIAALFLIRSVPRGDRAGPPAQAVAVVGTFIMGVVASQPPTTHDWRVLAMSDALLVGGLAFSIYAALSLRESFGLAAEARELVTSGAYRLVRHPIYLGELVAATGALLPAVAPMTTLVFAVFCLSQVARAILEERVLSTAFSHYEEYRRRTPALVPWPRPNIRA
jgi:protein-S-isoprenylcysteine O-methyltransferase Ste14